MTWSSDAAGHTVGGWGIGATVREYARFGYLYQKNGSWNGAPLVPEAWIRESLRAAGPASPATASSGGWRPASPTTPKPGPVDTLRRAGALPQKIFVVLSGS